MHFVAYTCYIYLAKTNSNHVRSQRGRMYYSSKTTQRECYAMRLAMHCDRVQRDRVIISDMTLTRIRNTPRRYDHHCNVVCTRTFAWSMFTCVSNAQGHTAVARSWSEKRPRTIHDGIRMLASPYLMQRDE